MTFELACSHPSAASVCSAPTNTQILSWKPYRGHTSSKTSSKLESTWHLSNSELIWNLFAPGQGQGGGGQTHHPHSAASPSRRFKHDRSQTLSFCSLRLAFFIFSLLSSFVRLSLLHRLECHSVGYKGLNLLSGLMCPSRVPQRWRTQGWERRQGKGWCIVWLTKSACWPYTAGSWSLNWIWSS